MTNPSGWVTTEDPPPARSRSLWAPVALALLVVGAFCMVAAQVDEATRFSPQDELQHFDYLVKVTRDHQLVRRGDLFGQEAMAEETCAGLDFGMTLPPCGEGPFDPHVFNEGGYNTASSHSPAYYATSGVVAEAMSDAVGSDSLFTTGRLTGGLWLAAGVAMMWLLMAELGVGWKSRVPVIVLYIATPTVIGVSAVINPDATATLAGASVAWAVLRAERTGRWGLLGLVCALGVALKVTNGVVVMVAVLYLLIRWAQAARTAAAHDRPTDHAAWWKPVLVALTATMLVAVGWLGISEAMARVDGDLIPMTKRMQIEELTGDLLGKNLGVGLTPLRDPYLPKELLTTVSRPMNDLVDRTFLIGLGAAALAAASRRAKALASSSLLVLAVIGPLYVVANYVTQGVYFAIPDRYALSVLPAVASVGAGFLDDRPWLRRGLMVGALVVLGFTLRADFTAP